MRIVPPTLAQCLRKGRDNFLLLRLLAAALVMFGHAWALASNPDGATDPLARVTGVFSGTVAVDVFFFVSGFLVTMSWARAPDPLRFAAARALRIFPGLVACVLFCALVIGPLATTLPVRDYLAHPDVAAFVLGNVDILHNALRWTLPGVFAGQPSSVVDGSLWTLPGELRLYVIVLALGVLGLLRTPARFALATAALAAVVLFASRWKLLQLHEYHAFAAFFAAGAACWYARDRLRVDARAAAALAVAAIAARGSAAYPVALGAALAYGVLWLAYAPRLPAPAGDCSYGVYLYGFPVQQCVAALFPSLGPWASLALALPAALLLAALSWRFIERPALRLKDRRKQSDPLRYARYAPLHSS